MLSKINSKVLTGLGDKFNKLEGLSPDFRVITQTQGTANGFMLAPFV